MADLLSGLIRRGLSAVVIRTLTLARVHEPIHHRFYELLARVFGPEIPWHFMNYGFDSPHYRNSPLALLPEDEADRLYIQLYDHLLSFVSIAGERVLEVGCGRGGGVAYLQRYLQPSVAIGLDRSHSTVRIGSSTYSGRNISFVTGDAHTLPFKDACIEVLVNVESSHAYSSIETFLREAARVLRPGGYLAFADLRWATPDDHAANTGLARLKYALRNCNLAVVHESDISSHVLQARAAERDRQRALIRAHVPLGLRSIVAELAGLPGTTMYRRIDERRAVYWCCILRKPPIGYPSS